MNYPFKGTVRQSLCDTPCTDGYVRFTMIHLKTLSDQVGIRFACFLLFCLFSFVVFLQKWLAQLLPLETMEEFIEKTLFESEIDVIFHTFDQIKF